MLRKLSWVIAVSYACSPHAWAYDAPLTASTPAAEPDAQAVAPNATPAVSPPLPRTVPAPAAEPPPRPALPTGQLPLF